MGKLREQPKVRSAAFGGLVQSQQMLQVALKGNFPASWDVPIAALIAVI